MIKKYIEDSSRSDIPNYKRENFNHFVRYTPSKSDLVGIIYFTKIEEKELDIRIEEQITYFKKYCKEFEWKVYDFDQPKNLKIRLLDHGFKEGDEETLMIYNLSQYQPTPAKKLKNIKIKKIEDLKGIKDVVDIQETIWKRSFPGLTRQLKSSLGNKALYCAYADGVPIGTGWIDYPSGSRFAEIHGGAIIPKYRGQGIYSQICEQRMTDAKSKGIDYVSVDASPMSRPILERRGFEHLCATYPLTKKLYNSGI